LPILHSGVSSYEPEAPSLGRGLKLMPSSAIPLDTVGEVNNYLENRTRQLTGTIRLMEQQKQVFKALDVEREAAYARLGQALDAFQDAERGVRALSERKPASTSLSQPSTSIVRCSTIWKRLPASCGQTSRAGARLGHSSCAHGKRARRCAPSSSSLQDTDREGGSAGRPTVSQGSTSGQIQTLGNQAFGSDH